MPRTTDKSLFIVNRLAILLDIRIVSGFWAENLLVLRRRQQRILLASDPRAATNLHDFPIEIATPPEGPARQIAEPQVRPPAPLTQNPRPQIQAILAEAGKPISHRQIRNAARMRAETVGNALRELLRAGQAVQTAQGYRFRGNHEPFPAKSPRG